MQVILIQLKFDYIGNNKTDNFNEMMTAAKLTTYPTSGVAKARPAGHFWPGEVY
jgi:hypothetical protein